MSTQPAHKLSTTITTTGGGSVVVGAPTGTLTATLAPFFKGDPGSGGVEQTFETVNKNLAGSPFTIVKTYGKIRTITYSTEAGSIIKTFGYSGDSLTSISLSGPGLPVIPKTTKTLVYENGELTGGTYT